MKYSKEVSDKLNELLEKNYDSEKVYSEAAERTDDLGLKNFFKAKAKQRYDFGHELKAEIKSMGEVPEKGSSTSADMKTKILALKDSILGTSDKSLLKKTISADQEAIDNYNKVLKETSVYPSTHKLLVEQRDAIYNSITDVDLAVESMTAPKRDYP